MYGRKVLGLGDPMQAAAAGPHVAEGAIDIKCTICDTGLRGPQIRTDKTPAQEAAVDQPVALSQVCGPCKPDA